MTDSLPDRMPPDLAALWERAIALHDLLFDDDGRVRVDLVTAAQYRNELGQLSDAIRRHPEGTRQKAFPEGAQP
jgi:hypothetical protein